MRLKGHQRIFFFLIKERPTDYICSLKLVIWGKCVCPCIPIHSVKPCLSVMKISVVICIEICQSEKASLFLIYSQFSFHFSKWYFKVALSFVAETLLLGFQYTHCHNLEVDTAAYTFQSEEGLPSSTVGIHTNCLSCSCLVLMDRDMPGLRSLLSCHFIHVKMINGRSLR